MEQPPDPITDCITFTRDQSDRAENLLDTSFPIITGGQQPVTQHSSSWGNKSTSSGTRSWTILLGVMQGRQYKMLSY